MTFSSTPPSFITHDISLCNAAFSHNTVQTQITLVEALYLFSGGEQY